MGELRRPAPPMEEFGRRVRAHRVKQGWSQEHLAEEAGLHMTYVSSLERGLRNVSLVNILRLCDALGVDPGKLLRGMHAD